MNKSSHLNTKYRYEIKAENIAMGCLTIENFISLMDSHQMTLLTGQKNLKEGLYYIFKNQIIYIEYFKKFQFDC